jgi:hypothetical protein
MCFVNMTYGERRQTVARRKVRREHTYDEVTFTLDDLGWGHLKVSEGGVSMSVVIPRDQAMVVARALIVSHRLGAEEACRG